MKKTVLLLMAVLMAVSIMIVKPGHGASVPLPEEINIVAPTPDVPPEIAAFSGRWEGDWDGVLDAVLIVTEITKTEATVIYAWGDAPEWNIKKSYMRESAKVSENKIMFTSTETGAEFTLEMRKDLKSVNVIRYDPRKNLEKETRLKKVD